MSRLPPERLAAAAEIAVLVVRSFESAHNETGGPWPFGCCNEAAVAVRDELRERAPDVCAEFVQGTFDRRWHAWVALRDGTILDPTVSQFPQTPPARIGVSLPGSPMAARYKEKERPTHV